MGAMLRREELRQLQPRRRRHSGERVQTPSWSWVEVGFKEGEAFEVNNRMLHRVRQTGPYERVTLIVDLLDEDVDATIEIGTQACRSWSDPNCFATPNARGPKYVEL